MSLFRNWRQHKAQSHLESDRVRFRVAPDVKASRHAEGVVLIHLSKGTVFSANRVGAIIWSGAEERQSLEQVTASISHEFDIPPQTALQDAAEFLRQLEAEGLLVAEPN